MRTSFLSGAGLAFAGALVLWGCGGGSGGSSTPTSPTPPSTPTAPTVTVAIVGSIGNSAYRPNPVTAATGATVKFQNNDSTTHHIVLDDGSADLGNISPGSTSTGVTIQNNNALKFHCTIHPSMVGSINGQSAPDPPPCNDPYGYGC
jgi:plastocyanin